MTIEEAKHKAMEAVQVCMPASWVLTPGTDTMSPKAVKLANYFANVMHKNVRESVADQTNTIIALLEKCWVRLERSGETEISNQISDTIRTLKAFQS